MTVSRGVVFVSHTFECLMWPLLVLLIASLKMTSMQPSVWEDMLPIHV